MTNRQKAFLAIFLVSLLGGAVTTVTKIGFLEIPPLTFTFLRFLLASLIILPLVLKSKKDFKNNFISLFPFSLFATANIILFILGVRTTTATISQLLYAGVPLLTGLITYILLSEKLRIRKIIGIIIGFLGVVIVIFLPVLEMGIPFSGDLLGNILISCGVISYSFYLVFSQKASSKYSPVSITSTFIFLTTVILLPFFLIDLKINYGWWNNVGFSGLTSLFYIAFMGTIGTYIIQQYAIKHGGSVFASMTYYLVPVFAFLSASLLLKEGLTIGLVIGGALALLGVFLTTK
ncbi:MAG: DMT family transporter [Candidatus Levyibacteriota bacterium]